MKRQTRLVLAAPEFLKQHGYQTALVGKWHLGYSYKFPEGEDGLRKITTQKTYGRFNVFSAPVGSKIIDGPVEHGFDEFDGFHHAREMHSWSKNDTVIENIPLDQVITRSTADSIRFIEKQAKAKEPTHPFVIHHSISGRFAIRKGDWKFIAARNSGGWSKGGDGKPSQLYDMATDRKESNNLVDEKPEIAAELTKLLETAISNGRSTPGPEQKNDAKVVIWKDGAGSKK